MLSEKEVEKIASLARIKISPEEKTLFQKELSLILDYIEKLNSVNTEGIEPLYQTTGIDNSTREDKHRDDFPLSEDLNDKLIGQAPHKQERFVKVKSVLNKK